MLVVKKVLVSLPIALMLVGAVGCSSANTGNASPTSATNGDTAATGGSSASSKSGDDAALASLKPCDLLDEQDLSKYHVEGAGRTDDPTAGISAWCRWTGRSSDDSSMVLGISIRPEQGIDELKATKGQLTTGSVNQHSAAELSGETGGSCTIALAVSQSSRVDVSVVGTKQAAEACQVASDIANVVEPKLPPEVK